MIATYYQASSGNLSLARLTSKMSPSYETLPSSFTICISHNQGRWYYCLKQVMYEVVDDIYKVGRGGVWHLLLVERPQHAMADTEVED